METCDEDGDERLTAEEIVNHYVRFQMITQLIRAYLGLFHRPRSHGARRNPARFLLSRRVPKIDPNIPAKIAQSMLFAKNLPLYLTFTRFRSLNKLFSRLF